MPQKLIKYFLNGKEVDRKVAVERKGSKLAHTHIVEERHYEAPLTSEEKKEKAIAFENASNYFAERRSLREDQEKFH